jgi:hypothetical protein
VSHASLNRKEQENFMASGQSPASVANRFAAGQSGNPAGRTPGARNKFSSQFVADVAADWSEHGAATIAKVREQSPERYFEVCSRLVPKEVAVAIEQRSLGSLSPDDMALVGEVLEAVREAIPDASSRQPGEVLAHVLAALRMASAPQIDGSASFQSVGAGAEKAAKA